MSDRELLQLFKDTGSESAFRGLVERYAGLVFAVALRRTGNRSLAEEVAQSVFLILAAKAQRLKPRGELASWLHRTTLLEASNAARKESVRQRKLEEFVEMTHNMSDPEWRQISPVLDEAIDKLKNADRSAVLLRFYEGLSFREVAATMGKTEAAARQQVSRALSKLSGILRRRGITTSAAVLSTGMAAHLSAGTVSATATATISQSAVTGAAGISKVSLFSNTINTMAYAKTKTATAVAILAAIPIGWQWSENQKLRENLNASGYEMAGGLDERDGTHRGSAASRGGGSRKSSGASAAVGATRRGSSGVGAWQQALFEQDPVQRSQRLASLLAQLDARTAPGVAELFFGEGEEKEFESEARLFMRAWAQLDGARAVAFLEEKGQTKSANGPILAALGGWASKDPRAARDWAEGAPEKLREDLLFGVIDGWALADFSAAADYAETRPRSGARTRFIQLLLKRSMANGDIAGAQIWFAGISNDDHNEVYKRRAFEGIVSTMLYRDPAAAAQWISSQAGGEFVSPSAVNSTAQKMAESSPEDALRWLSSMSALDADVSSRTHAGVLAQWASNEPEDAGHWLGRNMNHSGYDEMARHYAASVAGIDSEGAQRWAQTIQDESERETAMISVARSRLHSHGESVEDLRVAGFSEEQISAAGSRPNTLQWRVSGTDAQLHAFSPDGRVQIWNGAGGGVAQGDGLFGMMDVDGDQALDWYLANSNEQMAMKGVEMASLEASYERAVFEQMQVGEDGVEGGISEVLLDLDPSVMKRDALLEQLGSAVEARVQSINLNSESVLIDPSGSITIPAEPPPSGSGGD